jgi:hypothetical protein
MALLELVALLKFSSKTALEISTFTIENRIFIKVPGRKKPTPKLVALEKVENRKWPWEFG